MSHGLLNHLDALENMSHYPQPVLEPVSWGQPASLSPSQEEHLSNQSASPSLSRLIKITNQRRKLQREAADGANFKTNYCTHKQAVWPERPASDRTYALCLTELTQERAYTPSFKTQMLQIILLESFSIHRGDAKITENFLFGRNRLPSEVQPKLAATDRFRSYLKGWQKC